VAPAEISSLITEQLQKLTESEDGGILTVGFLVALWSSSAATVSVVDALNRAYDIDEARPWWKVRLTAIALTLALALTLIVATVLVLAGPAAADWLAARTGWGAPFEWGWKILQWPLVVALVAVGLGLLNYFGPDAEQDWEWITPGALLSSLLWLLTSLAFKLYVANFGSYNETYGSLGAVIVLMLWLYLSGVAILTGAEMNAEIEHASPHGKAPGEKVPGQRKLLGARAARAFAAKPAPASPRAPLPPERQLPSAEVTPRIDRSPSFDWLTVAAQVGVAVWAYRRAARSERRD
jgi:membrane protein